MKLIVCAVLGLSLLHCGSDSGDTSSGSGGASAGGSGGGGASDYPADSSAPGIAAFLAANSYQSASWTSETSTPREATSVTSPHGRVRVWLNSVVVASHAAGEGSVGGTPLDPGSMAVKELYDDADTLVGRAVLLRVGATEADSDTVYYCVGPDGRCVDVATESAPVYGAGAPACASCHGGLVYTGIPQ